MHIRKRLLPVFMLGLSLILSSAPSFAEDDVYVDFSVLDALGDNNSPVINNGPLFPIVKSVENKAKKTPSIKKVQQKKASKAVAKKVTPKKNKKENKKKEDSIKIPQKESVKIEVKKTEPQPVLEKKLNPEANTANQKKSEVIPTDSPFKTETIEAVQDKISAAPIDPVDVKTEKLPENVKEVIMEPVNGHTPIPETKQKQVENNQILTTAIDSLEEKVDEQKSAEKVIPVSKSQEKVEPLIDKNEVPADVKVSSDIVFTPDSAELTEENKKQLDKIIASFEDIQKNKISIFSFNEDDGNDVFRKKRLCLDRAIAVRSYYLAKGYKNYSIKVVNVDADSGLQDIVRVEEFK